MLDESTLCRIVFYYLFSAPLCENRLQEVLEVVNTTIASSILNRIKP